MGTTASDSTVSIYFSFVLELLNYVYFQYIAPAQYLLETTWPHSYFCVRGAGWCLTAWTCTPHSSGWPPMQYPYCFHLVWCLIVHLLQRMPSMFAAAPSIDWLLWFALVVCYFEASSRVWKMETDAWSWIHPLDLRHLTHSHLTLPLLFHSWHRLKVVNLVCYFIYWSHLLLIWMEISSPPFLSLALPSSFLPFWFFLLPFLFLAWPSLLW